MRRVALAIAVLGGLVLCAGQAASAPLRVATAPSVASFSPPSGPFGTKVTIGGSNFSGATAVRFNGTPASKVVVTSASSITATVAAGSSTGKIDVVTPGGTGTSASSFTVTPGVANLKVCAATNAEAADPNDPDSAFGCGADQGGTSFAPGDSILCGFETYNTTGHTVTMDWTHNGVPVGAQAATRVPAAGDADHETWWGYHTQDPALPTGPWACRVKVDGTVTASRQFTVVASSTKAPLAVYATYLDSLDPALAYYTESWRALSATCAGLVGWKDGGPVHARTLFPDAATALPTISSDGLTYTFTIRSGMVFAPGGNGSVTPGSFVRAFQRAARVPGSSGAFFADVITGFNAYASGSASSITGLSVSGSQLQIHLTHKQGTFLARLAMTFFCAVPAATPLTAQNTVPSAGPYYVAPGADLDAGAQLLRNLQYGGHRPHGADEIDIRVGTPPRYGIESGAVDAGFTFPAADWATIYSQYGPSSVQKRAFAWPGASVIQFTFDTAKSYLGPKVRRAIATGIDRTALAQTNGGVPTSSLLSTNQAGYTGTGPYALTADVATARSLMASAGYSSGHHLALTLVTCLNIVCTARGSVLTSQLAQIYIDLTVSQVQNPYQVLAGTNWDIGSTGWDPDFPDPWDNLGPLFATGGSANLSRYASATFDTALAAADAKTGAGRASAFGSLATSLATGDAPATTWETSNDLGFFSTRIECVTYGAYGANLALLNDKNTGAACGTDASE
jgi:ABC-type transport system substrate-binding protein